MRTCSEVYNLIEEKVYGEKNTYISYHLRTMLNENEDSIPGGSGTQELRSRT